MAWAGDELGIGRLQAGFQDSNAGGVRVEWGLGARPEESSEANGLNGMVEKSTSEAGKQKPTDKQAALLTMQPPDKDQNRCCPDHGKSYEETEKIRTEYPHGLCLRELKRLTGRPTGHACTETLIEAEEARRRVESGSQCWRGLT